jgi:hypothetical protein
MAQQQQQLMGERSLAETTTAVAAAAVLVRLSPVREGTAQQVLLRQELLLVPLEDLQCKVTKVLQTTAAAAVHLLAQLHRFSLAAVVREVTAVPAA